MLVNLQRICAVWNRGFPNCTALTSRFVISAFDWLVKVSLHNHKQITENCIFLKMTNYIVTARLLQNLKVPSPWTGMYTKMLKNTFDLVINA